MILTQLTDRTKILLTMMMSSFVTPFTSSALTLSLPDIGRDYSASANELGWVLEIFLLASIVCLLPMGKLADRFGKRRVFLWGTVLFTLSSALCIVTPDMGFLLAARALQGVAAAMLYATNMSIVALSFPPEQRGRALGWMVSMVYVGLCLRPSARRPPELLCGLAEHLRLHHGGLPGLRRHDGALPASGVA